MNRLDALDLGATTPVTQSSTDLIDAGGESTAAVAEPVAAQLESHVVGLCPRFHRAVELIGKRWTGAILRVLQGEGGRARFNAIAAAIPDMSDRMLSERLRELEHEGILARIVVPETPVRVEYELTEKGRALDATFCAIARWAEAWGTTDGRRETGGGSEQEPSTRAAHD
jgi:DNA-binding HxlR family transcriptional regulator